MAPYVRYRLGLSATCDTGSPSAAGSDGAETDPSQAKEAPNGSLTLHELMLFGIGDIELSGRANARASGSHDFRSQF